MKSAASPICVVLLVISVSLLITGWTFTDNLVMSTGWALYVFIAGAFLIGRCLLGYRVYYTASDGTRLPKDYNALLWFAGGVACASLAVVLPWVIALTAFAGMVTGSFAWPPKADEGTCAMKPVAEHRTDAHEANQMVKWVRPTRQPDHPVHRGLRADVPDMTQPTDHPD